MNTIRGTFALAVLLAAAGCVHGAADRSTDPSSSRTSDPVSVAMVPVAYDGGAGATAWDAGMSAAVDGASIFAWDGGASAARGAYDAGAPNAMDAGFAATEAGRMDAGAPQKGASALGWDSGPAPAQERGAKTLRSNDAGAKAYDAAF